LAHDLLVSKRELKKGPQTSLFASPNVIFA
jgi:hypothetical protein